MRPIVLTIAGSDPSGGAGIQADIKSIEANRGYAAAAVTAITVQNTRGVLRTWALPADLVRDQVEAVLTDLDVSAVKCGMLADETIVREVAAVLQDYPDPDLVVDPVMRATEGCSLLDDSALGAMKESLFPRARLVTPNVAEAEILSGVPISNVDDAVRAGREILGSGCSAVLVTGGHLTVGRSTDVLITGTGERIFAGETIDTEHTHGSGCTYASAIATRLARGESLEAAVAAAKEFITEALRHGLPIGHGSGPTDPFHFLSNEIAAGPPAGKVP